MAKNIEGTDIFKNSDEPVWLTTEYGMWINMELDNASQPNEIAKGMDGHRVSSDPIYHPQNPISKSTGPVVNNMHHGTRGKSPNQAIVMNTPDKLDSDGLKIFQELLQDCNAARERSSKRSPAVDQVYQNSLNRFMKADKWTVKKIGGKTGFYATVGTQIHPFGD